jgi:hypothetical protein
MRKALLLSFALMLVAGMAFGQAGTVGVFADQNGSVCNLSDSPAGTKDYYVVHINYLTSGGVQFLAKVPSCFTGSFNKDAFPSYALVIGATQTGCTVTYDCRSTPVLLATITLNVLGTTPACCQWNVTADPVVGSGQIEVSDCDFNVWFASGYHGTFNPNSGCQCPSIPTEDTTWGQVKALYE